jgi:hypothetical protein
MIVIARSDSDEAIHTCFAATWIASLTLAMTGKKFLHPSFRDGPKDQTRNLEIPGSR